MQFSVVIPTYNRASYLIKTVQSVLAQDYTDFELIIVDDGSTDDTEQTVFKLYDSNPKVRYFKTINRERGAARNFGFEQAKGDYVCFLDSDDLLLPNHLNVLSKAINKNPTVNFWVTKYRLKGQKGKVIQSGILALQEGFKDYRLLLKGNYFAALVCVKRENDQLIKFIEDRQYSSMEDWIFNLQNAMINPFYLIDKLTVEMTDHPGRSMADNKLVIEKRLLAMNYLLENLALTQQEQKVLKTYSYIFCTIHSILEHSRKPALRYLGKAFRQSPFKGLYLFLLLKIIIGQKLIKAIHGNA